MGNFKENIEILLDPLVPKFEIQEIHLKYISYVLATVCLLVIPLYTPKSRHDYFDTKDPEISSIQFEISSFDLRHKNIEKKIHSIKGYPYLECENNLNQKITVYFQIEEQGSYILIMDIEKYNTMDFSMVERKEIPIQPAALEIGIGNLLQKKYIPRDHPLLWLMESELDWVKSLEKPSQAEKTTTSNL